MFSLGFFFYGGGGVGECVWREWEMGCNMVHWLSFNLIFLMAPTEPSRRVSLGFQKICAVTIWTKPGSSQLWDSREVMSDVVGQLYSYWNPREEHTFLWSEMTRENPSRDIKLESVVFSLSVQCSQVDYSVGEGCWLFSWAPDEEAGQLLEAILYENSRYLSTGLMLGAERHSRAEETEWTPVPHREKNGRWKFAWHFMFICPVLSLIIMLLLLFLLFCWVSIIEFA